MSEILDIAKRLGVGHNVCIRVIDEVTDRVVSEYIGHNAATSTLLTGVGHFLMGEASTGGSELLADWLPQYISLGTMGLRNQEEDRDGLPAGIGDGDFPEDDEEDLFKDYMSKIPGFAADHSDDNPVLNNYRKYYGLGNVFADRPSYDPEHPENAHTAECELISNKFPRSRITFRQCLPESRSEIPKTIDVIYSALISTGALAQFREPGKDYLFISEVGLWSRPDWTDVGLNGLLAGYRLCPSNRADWDMTIPENRDKLKASIIRVGINQVVQVIWKIQIGAVEQVDDSGGWTWNIV